MNFISLWIAPLLKTTKPYSNYKAMVLIFYGKVIFAVVFLDCIYSNLFGESSVIGFHIAAF